MCGGDLKPQRKEHRLKKGWKIERQVRGALLWSFWFISIATKLHGLPPRQYVAAAAASGIMLNVV